MLSLRGTRACRASVILAFAALLFAAGPAFPQAEEAARAGGQALENRITGRSVAFRLRAELQFTEDDDELVDQDPNYASFPTEIYSAEAKLFEAGGGKDITVNYSTWENDQGLDSRRWSWRFRGPLNSTAERRPYLSLRYNNIDDDIASYHYLYLGMDKLMGKCLYGQVQYRLASQDGNFTGHQIDQYLSWQPTGRLRVGEQAAVSFNENSDDLRPAYGDLFATIFFIPERTALRLKYRHYESSDTLNYDEYNAYIYQKLTARSWLRLGYRFYDDSQDRDSNAYGTKLKYYFSDRFAAHAGYRLYDHSTQTDFDTAYGGFELIL